MAANTFDGSGEGRVRGSRRIWHIVPWGAFPRAVVEAVRLKLGYSGEAITSKEAEALSLDGCLKKSDWGRKLFLKTSLFFFYGLIRRCSFLPSSLPIPSCGSSQDTHH